MSTRKHAGKKTRKISNDRPTYYVAYVDPQELTENSHRVTCLSVFQRLLRWDKKRKKIKHQTTYAQDILYCPSLWKENRKISNNRPTHCVTLSLLHTQHESPGYKKQQSKKKLKWKPSFTSFFVHPCRKKTPQKLTNIPRDRHNYMSQIAASQQTKRKEREEGKKGTLDVALATT